MLPPPLLHPEDGGSMVLQNNKQYPTISLHNPADQDLRKGS